MELLPDVSIVVPSLDDAVSLEDLMADLRRQQGLTLQVIVVEAKRQPCCAARTGEGKGFPLVYLESPPGRGRQMNGGARRATAADLLFFHADTRLEDPLLLRRALEHMRAVRTEKGGDKVAGHFALRFRASQRRRSLAFQFLEAKSLMNRPDCINGDQGFWISNRWFHELGCFDESLPFLEDARLAHKISATGIWTRLPGRVSTSPRRFEAEGLFERQTVNALVRAFEALGEPSFAGEAHGLYRTQAEATRLALLPFFEAASRVMSRGSVPKRANRWLLAGAFACAQIWQVVFWGELVARSILGFPTRSDLLRGKKLYEKLSWRLFDNKVARAAGAAASYLWLHGTKTALFLREKRRRRRANGTGRQTKERKRR